MTSTESQLERTLAASTGRPFSFEQGSSLHAGILGMVLRPSGPHDEDPFVSGTSRDGRSQASLDLARIHDDVDGGSPSVLLWFDDDHTVVDISAAFGDAPAEALEGSGIPAAVVNGAVSVDNHGDAGDGVTALVTQMCGGKFVIDPAAMLALIGSEGVTDFAESQSKEYLPLRAFNARMKALDFLDAIGLTVHAAINQIAVLGYDMRTEVGPTAAADFEAFLGSMYVDLAWFIDDQDRVQTVQAVTNLTDFFSELLRRESVLEKMAHEEGCSVPEMLEFVEETAAQQRLVYINVNWQTFQYHDDIAEIEAPDAADVSPDFAAQAAGLRGRSALASPGGRSAPRASRDLPTHVTVDDDMVAQMAASSGAMHFVLTRVDGDAIAAMQAAQLAVGEIPHPDEPAESLASFLSEIVPLEDGAQFWADISDMEEHTQLLQEVLAVVAVAIGASVVSGHLSGRAA